MVYNEAYDALSFLCMGFIGFFTLLSSIYWFSKSILGIDLDE